MKAVGDLAGGIRELVADGAIRDRNAVIDGGTGRPGLPAGLEPDVIQERRFGKVPFRNVAGVMSTLPPLDKVQQVVRIDAQGFVSYRICVERLGHSAVAASYYWETLILRAAMLPMSAKPRSTARRRRRKRGPAGRESGVCFAIVQFTMVSASLPVFEPFEEPTRCLQSLQFGAAGTRRFNSSKKFKQKVTWFSTFSAASGGAVITANRFPSGATS